MNRDDAEPGSNDEPAIVGTLRSGPALRGELRPLEPLPAGEPLVLEG